MLQKPRSLEGSFCQAPGTQGSILKASFHLKCKILVTPMNTEQEGHLGEAEKQEPRSTSTWIPCVGKGLVLISTAARAPGRALHGGGGAATGWVLRDVQEFIRQSRNKSRGTEQVKTQSLLLACSLIRPSHLQAPGAQAR